MADNFTNLATRLAGRNRNIAQIPSMPQQGEATGLRQLYGAQAARQGYSARAGIAAPGPAPGVGTSTGYQAQLEQAQQQALGQTHQQAFGQTLSSAGTPQNTGDPVSQLAQTLAAQPGSWTTAGLPANPNPASYSPSLGITSGYPGYDFNSQGGLRDYMAAQGYQFRPTDDPTQATYATTDMGGHTLEQGSFFNPTYGKSAISLQAGSGPVYGPGTGTMGGPGGGNYRPGPQIGYWRG